MEIIEQPTILSRARASRLRAPGDSLCPARTGLRVFCADELMAGRNEALGSHIIIDGIACRFTLTPDGRRQFTELLLPGDVIALEWLLNLPCADNVVALTRTLCRPLARRDLSEPDSRRILRDAVQRQLLVANEWILNLGARPAPQRLAHFFHETLMRMRVLGIGACDGCDLPLTQVELGDFLALTPVHINRCLGILRRGGMATFRSGRLTVHDLDKLRQYAHADAGSPM